MRVCKTLSKIFLTLALLSVAIPASCQYVDCVASTGGGIGAVAVRNSLVYFGEGSTFIILDASDPTQPRVLSRLRFKDTISHIALSDRFALVSTASLGFAHELKVVDVSNPESPFVVSGLIGGQQASISGTLVFAATSNAMIIYDISQPEYPVKLYEFSEDAISGAVSGSLFGIGERFRELVLYDVTYPSAPVEVGSFRPPHKYVQDVIISNGYAYIAAGPDGLMIVDVSHPEAPILVGQYDSPGFARRLRLSGSLVFMAEYAGGLQIVDVSDPAHPELLGAFIDIPEVRDVAVEGQVAYVADESDSLRILDVSDPAQPRQLGEYLASGAQNGIKLHGTTALVVSRSFGIHIYDISDPLSPVPISNYHSALSTYGFDFQYPYAYLLGYFGGLEIVDLSDLRNPKRVSLMPTPGGATRVVASGSLLYILGPNSTVHIMDVSNPAAPAQVGVYRKAGGSTGIAVKGSYLYLSSGVVGLQIVDVSDPAHPVEVGSLNASIFTGGVTIGESLAVVTGGDAGYVNIIDISNPRAMRLLATFSAGSALSAVALEGDRLYLGPDSLQVWDISNPTNPTLIGEFDEGTYVIYSQIAVSNGNIYAACDQWGLRVFRYSPGPELSGGFINRSEGSPEDTFYWQVRYAEDLGIPPVSAHVLVDDNPVTMTALERNPPLSKHYRSQSISLPEGLHTYYYLFRNAAGEETRLPAQGVFYGPRVGYGIIQGTVLDRTTNQPLEGVDVVAYSYYAQIPIGRSAVTDATGEFILTQVPPGRITIELTDFAHDTQNVSFYLAVGEIEDRGIIALNPNGNYEAGFTSTPQGWGEVLFEGSKAVPQPFSAASASYENGGLRLFAPANSSNYFGQWNSPATIPYRQGKLYRASWVVSTDQPVASQVPSARFRLSAETDNVNVDVLQINATGTFSNVPPAAPNSRLYRQYFQPVDLTSLQGSSSTANLKASFDLIDFSPEVSGSLFLDILTVEAFDPPELGIEDRSLSTFHAAEWLYAGGSIIYPLWEDAVGEGFESETFSITVPTTSSRMIGLLQQLPSEKDSAPSVVTDALYRARFTLARSADTEPYLFPQIRLRLADSNGEASVEYHLLNGGGGIAAPGATSTIYDVYLVGPAYAGETPRLVTGFDLIAFNGGEHGTIQLEQVDLAHGPQP